VYGTFALLCSVLRFQRADYNPRKRELDKRLKMGYNPLTMTTSKLSITTAPRAPKETKKDGFIPAVYYGSHLASTPIFIDAIEFKKVLAGAGESSSIELVTESGHENAMIQDVQFDPVKGMPIHADFYVIEKGQKVHVKTPIEFIGESQAVKEGGVLVKVMHELSIEGEPSKLPQNFEVDIAKLVTMQDVIKVGDIKLPAGVELYHVTAEDIIASIAEAKEEEEVAPVATDLSAIEVEQKGKKEEEGGAPTEGEAKAE
jgi:large subunit ribosomal protein L25